MGVKTRERNPLFGIPHVQPGQVWGWWVLAEAQIDFEVQDRGPHGVVNQQLRQTECSPWP